MIKRNFYSRARSLRRFFDHTFADPYTATRDRFVWDSFYIKNQYFHLRTPASIFFPQPLFTAWMQDIQKWGYRHLGCRNISAPWLSLYLNGHYQRGHTDVPHGPWAFVFSLSTSRQLQGGRTWIDCDPDLRIFHSQENLKIKKSRRVLSVKPTFNQLLVFDPRLPHMVEEVVGAEDPCHGRLVIHGWFTEPEPLVEGALSPRKVQPTLDQLALELSSTRVLSQPWNGALIWELGIGADGSLTHQKILTNTLRPQSTDQLNSRHMRIHAGTLSHDTEIQSIFQNIRFPVSKRRSRKLPFGSPSSPCTTRVTLPLLFR